MQACKNDKVNLEVVALIMENVSDVNVKDRYGRTALHFACENGVDKDVVKYLLENGSVPNMKDSYGKNSLHFACETENPSHEVIKHLLSAGTDPNSKDIYRGFLSQPFPLFSFPTLNFFLLHVKGYTPLHAACENENLETKTLQLLISKGADVNLKTSMDSDALDLLITSRIPDVELINFMIKFGLKKSTAVEKASISIKNFFTPDFLPLTFF